MKLSHGKHDPPNGVIAMCAMEAASWIAREPWSDYPKCVSPVIGAAMRGLNDSMNDEDRQQLVPYVLRSVGTANGQSVENRRAWMAVDWLVRVYTPAWLRLAKLDGHARALEGLAQIVDARTCRSAQSTLEEARSASAGAEDAARAAARAGAEDAAWAAARAAAEAAVWDAAWDAAWAAAEAAVWDAAWDAAWAAAWDAAWDAARAAVRAAAWDAVWDAARGALRPTVVALQQSFLALLNDMIALHKTDVPVDAERVALLTSAA